MTCNKTFQKMGVAYPRTCADCGLGPCRKPPVDHTEAPAEAPAKPANSADRAAFYAKGFAEGLRHGRDHDIATLIDKAENARMCLDMEIALRLDAERTVEELQGRLAGLHADLNTARRAA